MSGRNLFLIIVVLVVLIAAGLIGYSFLGRKSTTATTPTKSTASTSSTSSSGTGTPATTTATTTTFPANSILAADPLVEADASKKRFSTAQDKLKSWPLYKSNAVFTGLFMTFDSKLELNSTNEVYVFDSPDDTADHFTVSVAQSSGNTLRAIIPNTDYQGTLSPIKLEFWLSNYVDAVQNAYKNGGKSFMDQNQITTVDAKLYRTTPNDFLYWVVQFHTKDVTKSLTVKIDAKDKIVVKE